MLATIQAILVRLFGIPATGAVLKEGTVPTPRIEPTLVYYPVPRLINRIVIHHSATPADRDIGVAEIAEWHIARGFSGVGYHFVIRRNGRVDSGRPIALAGAHVRGYNHDSIGICLVGGVDKHLKAHNNFTPYQFGALAGLLDDLLLTWPGAEICGHKDLAATECPAFDVKGWWAVEGEQRYVQ